MTTRKKLGPTAYCDSGSGEPVILIHGVGLNADAWEPQRVHLASSRRVIAIDLLGHGESDAAPANATLDSYTHQIITLMDGLDIRRANIIGHSLGGLIAINFALQHPQRTLRLVALNTVYKRTTEQRQAVLSRAAEIRNSGSVGDIEKPLGRWFGTEDSAWAATVRKWLTQANPNGYATAYQLFAESDEAFTGKLQNLKMPTLFATGTDDLNSSPGMSVAMAAEVKSARSHIINGARHMMNLTHATETSGIIEDLLNTSLHDPRDLRTAFGTFMTGVTVVTTKEEYGTLRGFTANSFSSVSLDPPLLLICIAKSAASCEAFSKAQSFAVNILSENQKDVSGVFASKRPDKFTDTEWTASPSGNPLIAGASAWFDCARHSVVDAGDHVILLGRVANYAHTDTSPLGYARGGYFTLGLEQSAVNAASQSGRTEVGAILEHNNHLIVTTSAQGYDLPQVGRIGVNGSASRLQADLAKQGIRAHLGFLYAVYENPETKTQSIYYRGEAEVETGASLRSLPLDSLPIEQFTDKAVQSMLTRYCSERQQGRYRIYSGDHISGNTKEVVA